jgi:hypothetical protein
VLVKLLQRGDAEKRAIEAKTEERDTGIEQAIHVERVYVLRRAVQPSELQMALEQLPDVRRARIVNRDSAFVHGQTLPERR